MMHGIRQAIQSTNRSGFWSLGTPIRPLLERGRQRRKVPLVHVEADCVAPMVHA